MAYDEELADRIRSLVDGEPGLSEKKMFGGLAFLVNGNMAVAASGQGGMLLRVDPTETELGPDRADLASQIRLDRRRRCFSGMIFVAAGRLLSTADPGGCNFIVNPVDRLRDRDGDQPAGRHPAEAAVGTRPSIIDCQSQS